MEKYMKEEVYLEFLAGILESLGTAIMSGVGFGVESIVPFATIQSLEAKGELPHHWAEKIFATTFKVSSDKRIEVIAPSYSGEEQKVLMSFDCNAWTGLPLKVIAYAVLNYIRIVYYSG
jgi:hypothetical protein